MKKLITLVAFAFALALVMTAAARGQQQPPPGAPKAAAPDAGMQARVFQLTHVSPNELERALRPLASVGSGASTIVGNNSTMTITVRDFPENLEAIAKVIALLDKPRPAPERTIAEPLEVQISLIAASADEGFREAPASAAIAPVLEQLRRTLSFRHYRYVTTLTQRVKQGWSNGGGGGGGASGFIADPFKTETPEARPAQYEYKLKDPFVNVDQSGAATATVQLDFALVLSRVTNPDRVNVGVETPNIEGQRISISTGLTFREGEQVVVGTSSAGEGDKSIIVVLTMRRVKM